MSVFDTHGGYFAPKDYTRINEGGSHDENPNGGVQLGIAPDGAPNLLEEGEPVYQDYVFSDNIKAKSSFLEKYNLPVSYDGKLYSDIADKLVDEAEERPLDPISRNGLNAMLSRLSEAQEGQKIEKEQKELERMLSEMTPEELEQLEAALTQPEEEPVPVVPEQITPEQIVPEQVEAPVMKCGGKIHRYDVGGWADFLNTVRNYAASRNRGGLEGKYTIDKAFDNYGYNTINDLEQSDDYINFTNYVLAHPNDPRVKEYLQALDKGTADWTQKLFDGDNLRQGWQDLYTKRRNDQKAGIYHLYDNNLIKDAASAMRAKGAIPVLPNKLQDIASDIKTTYGVGKPATATLAGTYPNQVSTDPVTTTDNTDETEQLGVRALPTFPRYGKAIGAGLLGLYNVATPPDHYTASRAVPYSPYGNIHLQNQRYVAVDPNTILNTQLAQSNSTARALQNSQSPSTAANMLALDNNTTRNVGTGLLQGIQANNQQRNAVIAANNAAEAQRAQFDYGVDRGRVMGLDMAQRQNLQNELLLQQLNNEAESAKYAAVSNQINAGLDALAGIGQENFAMNQLNSNAALNGYMVAPNGIGGWQLMPAPKKRECGGTLLKKYKK